MNAHGQKLPHAYPVRNGLEANLSAKHLFDLLTVESRHCASDLKGYGRAMNEAPTCLLKPLASLEEQRRYIIGGTEDEYLLPDELVHDAFRFCEHFENAERSGDMTTEQREALDRLREALTAFGRVPERYDRTNISELVEHDEAWAVMRQRAKEALKSFTSSAA